MSSDDPPGDPIDSERGDTPLVPLSEYEEQVLGNHRSPSRESDDLNGLSVGYPASESGVSAISASTIATPNKSARKRADLVTTTQHRQDRTISIAADDDILNESIDQTNKENIEDRPNARLYIWGTRVCVMEMQEEFRNFITNFTTQQLDDDENAVEMESGNVAPVDSTLPYYMEKLKGIFASEIPILNLNLAHVRQFNEHLYKIIISYPDEVLTYLDATIDEIFEMTYNKKLPSIIEIRPYNAEQTKTMRDLNPQDVGQLVTICGMVTRISPIIPEMKTGYFQCALCNAPVVSEVDCGRIEEPVKCSNCHDAYSFQLIHNRSFFIDKQVVKLQEIPGDMPAGQTQHSVTLFVHGSLVESVHPGDRCSVTGIYRATPIRVNPLQRTVHSIYRTSIDVIHFRKLSQDRLHEPTDGLFMTEERIQQVLTLSKCDDIIDRLTKAVAPNIFGHEEIKKGILCLLFGGSRKWDEQKHGEEIEEDETVGDRRIKVRSDINILLCGDPGTAKSQLLQYVYHLVPRAQFTSGKGSSAVGLSASITRDPDSRSVVLQTGALVLADNGVCCIDEFDKMNDSTRSILHEVMEQQTLSIAKAGIICQLNARTSILAAANPVDSQWNKRKNIVENVHLPPTLLSRFDLIFLVLDPQDEEYDRRLAKHLVNFYLVADTEAEQQQRVDMAFLRDYIAYAKANICPVISEKAGQLLVQKYQFMRSLGKKVKQISAYPRQLEALIRLSEAFAKMRLSNEVSENDVEMAYELQREALRQSAVNPDTGCVEVNIIATGYSEKHKQFVGVLAEQIRQELEGKRGNFSLGKLFKDMRINDKALDRECYEDAIKQLVLEGFLLRNGDKSRVVGIDDSCLEAMNNNSSSTSNNNNSPSTTAIAYAVAAAGIPLNSRNSSSFNSLTDQQQQHSSNFYSNKTCHFEQQSGDYLCHYNTSAPFNHFTQQNRGHFDDCTATNYSTDPSTQQQLQLSACNGLYQLEHNANIGLHTSIIPYQRSVQLATTTFHHPQNYPNNLNCYSNFTQPVVDWSGGNTSGRTGGDLYLRVDATLEIGTANSIGGSAAYNWHMGGSGGNHNLIPQFNQHHHNNNNSMIDCLTSNNSQINNNFGINCQKQTTNSLIGTSTNCLQISQTSSQQLPNNLIKTQQQQYSPEKPFRSIKKLKNIKKEIQTTKKFISSPNKNKFYVCNICGRQYCRKSTLKAHMKNHVGERPFICPICGKHFSQAANLTAHRRVHTGEKPFSCPVCYRPFSQSSSLVTHKRTHTGERPYPCPHCEKAFTDSSTLTKHLRTHTGQKPYSCAICAMRFSQSGNLHRHMKTHTSEIR